jgi:hypothetical protein
MLDSEEAEQNCIDDHSLSGKRSRTRINGFGNEEDTDEADGVEKSQEENQVCDDPIEKRCNPAQGGCLLSWSLGGP